MTKRILSVLFIVTLLTGLAPAQQPGEVSYHDESIMPEGKIGERIRSIVETLNSGDPERVKKFFTEEVAEDFRNFAPLEEHIKVFLGVLKETGGVDFHSIRTYVPERKDETVVILKDKNFGSWRAITARFTEAPDYLIKSLAFGDARTPTNVEEPPLTEKEAVQAVEDLLQRLIEIEAFSGTVLIAKGENVIFSMAGGEASKRFHVPNNIDTKFNLGSMNKMFTSTAIMQLAEKGLVSLDDPISKYVDESWLPQEVTDKITVHHLLTHTSGLGSYFNEKYMESSKQLFRKLDDYKSLIQGDRPRFEPGKQFRYSNTGMFLLGVVIEKATGEDYFDHIRDNIYAPAGMNDSDCYEMDYPVENLAIGYSPDLDSPYGWQNNLYKHVIKGGPAGGGFSTVVDLHRFALALLTGKLVSKESLEKMWTDHAGAQYGYGFRVDEGANGKVVGHGGGFSGINSNLDIYLDKGYIVAVMSNIDRGASPVARRFGELLSRVK